jgi:PAS domain S-box-containing protein
MHRLLQRQIKKLLNPELLELPQIKEFIGTVNEAYKNFNADYEQLERTLEISAKESFKELNDLKNAISITSIVMITDFKWNITFVNDNFLHNSGYRKDEVIGYPIMKFYSTYHKPKFYQEMHKTIENGQVWKGEIMDKTKDGSPFWTDTTIVPLLNDMGKPFKYITFKFDITKIKNAERESQEHARNLEKINLELDQFAYVVSHDLKAPLRAINNLSEWIEEDLQSIMNEDNKTNMNLLRGRVKRMEGLIDGILEYSRVGRVKAKIVKVNLNELFQELKDANYTKKNTEITFPQNLPVIHTERVTLYQVLQNLISNAIKYNNSEVPRVDVKFEIKPPFFHFIIADNGMGIAPEYLTKIFVIFQTLHARDKMESTGVGLAIVKKIVEDKGGKITVTSEVGYGSTFAFSWPIIINNQTDDL